jgi:Protein of unknown function (DUF3168)
MSNTAAWDLQAAIYNKLTNDADVSAAVEGRVLDSVPQGTDYPMIVIGEGANTDAATFGSDDREMRPEIQIWTTDGETTSDATGSSGYKTAEAIAALVRGVMMAASFSIDGYAGATVIRLEDEHGERIAVTDTLLCRCIKQTYLILLEDA